MKIRTKATLSLFLIVCIILSSLSGTVPVAALGATALQSEEAGASATLTGQTAESQRTILQEDVSLRKEYEKHFLMSDGSYQVALYNEPVHKLENGNWVEIDNTLTLRSTRSGSAQYATTNGLADVCFAQDFGAQLVTVQQDAYSLSWDLHAVPGTLNTSTQATLNRSVQAEIITDNISAVDADEQKTLAAKSASAIQYRNALASGVDLEYIVTPSRIKENIILHSKQDISYYTVTVHLENLSARLLENREIEFYNNNEVVFTMTSPYMYDSAGELTENITVELISKGSGSYDIKMVPDAQWLSSQDRVYPIVIDPQVSVNSARSNIIDNYVLEGSGNQNRNLDRLYIGNKSGKLARAFVKYDTMPTLPDEAQVTDATMTLTILNGTSTASNINAYQVTGGDWASDSITWANMPPTNTRLAANISHNNLTKYTFSCRVAAQYWYRNHPNGDRSNYGFMFSYSDETIDDYNAVYSADCSSASKRPAMVIYYTGEDDGSDGGTDSGPNFDAAESIALDSRKYIDITGANEEKIYKFIPPIGGEYLFYSSNATSLGDPYVTIYSSSGSILHSDDNTGGNKNFRLVASLTEGISYYIGTKHTGDKVGAFDINVLISCTESNISECHLKNLGSSLYIDIHGPEAQNLVHQWSYQGNASARWTIKKQSDGYHTIQSAYGDKHYIGISSTSVGTDNIRLYATISDSTRWKLFVKSTGEIFMEPKNAKGRVLCASSQSKDDELQLTYISDNNMNHKWKIACRTNIAPEGQRWDVWCWVTSARMFAKHYYSSVTRTQDDAVSYIKGYVSRSGGWERESKEAVEYYIGDISGASLNLQYVNANGGSNCKRYSEQALRHFLNDGHVVLIARSWYSGSVRTGGHALVVAGYTTVFNKGSLSFHYVIYDPWPVSPPVDWEEPQNTSGQEYLRSYAWICNGNNISNIDSPDNGIWEGFVTVITSYSDDTLPPVYN